MDSPGVTAVLALDATPVPMAFVARTVNVYAVPFDNPLIAAVVTFPAVVELAPPGLAVTM